MRQIGSVPSEELGRRFEDYLLTCGIQAQIDQNGDSWAVWVLEEDQIEQSKQELHQFLEHPDAEQFVTAAQSARSIRKAEEKARQRLAKAKVRVRGELERPTIKQCPVTSILILISVAVTIFSDFGEAKPDDLVQACSIASYETAKGTIKGTQVFYRSKRDEPVDVMIIERKGKNVTIAYWVGLQEIFRDGQVWRLFTPMFLHFAWMHIVFNMLWLYLLGMSIEFIRGHWRFVAIVLATAAASALGQYYMAGNPRFGGMSGVIYGLFGYIWCKSVFDPGSGFFVPPQTLFWVMLAFVICWSGALGPVANWGHTFGLLSGGVIGYAPILWGRLTKPTR